MTEHTFILHCYNTVIFSVNACVTYLNEAFWKHTEQTAFHIGSIRNVTFHCQIKDDCIFYGTGGNPNCTIAGLASTVASFLQKSTCEHSDFDVDIFYISV